MPIVAALAVLAPVRGLGPQEGRWGPAPITPAQLAGRVDNALATLSNATVTFQYQYDKSTVGHGTATCQGTIVSPKVFFLQVPQVNPGREKEVLLRERWISDGKHFGWATEPDQPKPGPLAKRPGLPGHPSRVWFTDFSRVILSGVGQATHPFATFLSEMTQLGYKPTLELRSLALKGRRLGWYRLVLLKGNSRYETIFDAAGLVPVSALNTVGKDTTRWVAVDWNLRPGKSLLRSAATFRKQGQVLGLSPKPVRRSTSPSR